MKSEVTIKQIVEHFGIQNVLVLENEMLAPDQWRFIRDLEEAGVKVVAVEQAYLDVNKQKVMAALPSTDTIFFESQFLYWEQVQGVGKLLMAVKKPLKIFGRNIASKSLMQGIEDTFDVKDLAVMSHHRVFELSNYYDHPSFLKKVEHFAEEKNMTRFKEQVEAEERKKAKAIADAPKEKRRLLEIQMRDVKETGRKVRILSSTLGQGKQWSNLQQGMEVPELDCLHMDPNPDRGVWVMGLHEPVKLLNDVGYNEWEYVEPDVMGLGLEILSMCSQRANPGFLRTFIPWINKAMIRIWHHTPAPEGGEGVVHMYVTELLDSCSVPRRGYRHTIMSKLKKYADSHKFFGEDKVILHRQVEELVSRVQARKAIIAVDQAAKRVAQEELEVNYL